MNAHHLFTTLLSIIVAAGCRSETPPAPPAPAAPIPVSAAPPPPSASIAPAADTTDPLPTREHLIAPFRGTKANGFVAMTAIDRPSPGRRAFVFFGSAEGVRDDRPVLIASFTKLWTAVAALRMVERGELSLDATVKEILPELAARPWSDSTMRELLTHTSRVPEFDDKAGGYYRRDVDFSSPVDVLAKYVPADWTEKRGVYKYRNSELAIAGAILATRAKMAADRVLTREVFELANMKNAGLLLKKGGGPANLDMKPMGAIRPQNFFTAGAGYASAIDLLAFFEALSGTTLLTEASKTLLFDGAAARGYGALGCWSYPFAKEADAGTTTRLVERPGTLGNVRLFTAFFPDERRAIVAWTGDGIDIARPRTGKGIGLALARVALE